MNLLDTLRISSDEKCEKSNQIYLRNTDVFIEWWKYIHLKEIFNYLFNGAHFQMYVFDGDENENYPKSLYANSNMLYLAVRLYAQSSLMNGVSVCLQTLENWKRSKYGQQEKT